MEEEAHLRLNQHQVDKQHDEVMLDVLVAEAPAVATDRQADIRARVPRARVLRPERPDGVAALDADGHYYLLLLLVYFINYSFLVRFLCRGPSFRASVVCRWIMCE